MGPVASDVRQPACTTVGTRTFHIHCCLVRMNEGCHQHNIITYVMINDGVLNTSAFVAGMVHTS